MQRIMSLPPEAGPPPALRFRRSLRPTTVGRELWRARSLVGALARREFLIRYKQAVLGVAWAVLSPLVLMALFTLVFQKIARVDTGDVPYPLFAFLGLLPWTFFSLAVVHGGQSLLINAPLVRKVYSPREVYPIASILVAGIDSLISLSGLAAVFVVTGYAPRATAVWVPLLFLIQLLFVVGVVLVLSSVIVFVRDVRHALPLALQLGIFATPVAYGVEAMPERFRWLYAAANPLVAVIDGYRRTILFGRPPAWGLVVPGSVTALLVFAGGYVIFKRLETVVADAV
ncbi:MAG: ABC transporter permease [Actinomycetota bacterium]|nr:ABC transporter permease [Actinomycetota bacterium]